MLAQHKPSVGSFLGTLFTDIGNLIKNPSAQTFYAIFADFAMLYIIPFVGGYMRMEMQKQYLSDPITYDNADITSDYLYNQAMSMFTTKFWEIFGQQ